MKRDAPLSARIAGLEGQVARLRRQLARANSDAADAQGDNAAASKSSAARADRADAASRTLEVENARLLTDAAFVVGILESSSDCIMVLDLDGMLTFMSRGGQRAMEVDDSTTVFGRPWPEFWPQDGRAVAEDALTQAAAGESVHFEGPAPTAKGNPRWWQVTVTPILDAEGLPARILAIWGDMTARKEAEVHREVLMRELHHRVANTLAMVSAITSQSLRHADGLQSAAEAISNRLAALAKAHTLLVDGPSARTTVRNVINGTIRPYDAAESRFSAVGDDLDIAGRSALALALALNELCTNATKYGALSNDVGRVDIAVSVDAAANRFRLTWTETGGPPVAAPSRRSFGSRLIEEGFTSQFGGKATLAFKPKGVTCTFEAPLKAMQDEA